MNTISKKIFLTATLIISFVLNVLPQNSRTPQEEDYYRILTLPVPEGILLEVGGVATLPDGRIAVCTRRGDVWTIENPAMENSDVRALYVCLHQAFMKHLDYCIMMVPSM